MLGFSGLRIIKPFNFSLGNFLSLCQVQVLVEDLRQVVHSLSCIGADELSCVTSLDAVPAAPELSNTTTGSDSMGTEPAATKARLS